MTLNAWNISTELEKRHRADMFFTEVKNGSTWFARHSRIDALAIKKSWANPCIVGYEIKVSRSDFVKDNKWQAYLQMCNELYFVCPKDLIALNEVPEPCGLRYMYETGFMKTVKKAPYREIEHPSEMYMYLLMNYASSAKPPFREDRYEQIEAYLADKERSSVLAKNFQSKLLQELAEYVKEKDQERWRQKKWKEQSEEYEKVVAMLKKYTGNNYLHRPSWELEKILSSNMEKAAKLANELEQMVSRFREANGLEAMK